MIPEMSCSNSFNQLDQTLPLEPLTVDARGFGSNKDALEITFEEKHNNISDRIFLRYHVKATPIEKQIVTRLHDRVHIVYLRGSMIMVLEQFQLSQHVTMLMHYLTAFTNYK